MPCQKCLDKWGAEPSAWGDSVVELNDYAEHVREHVLPSVLEPEDDYPCASGCTPSEGDVCGGPRCT